jgi:hypothetical protein
MDPDLATATLSFRMRWPSHMYMRRSGWMSSVRQRSSIMWDNTGVFLRSCTQQIRVRGTTTLLLVPSVILAAEVFSLVSLGTRAFSTFVNPEELVCFFAKPLTGGGRPCISWTKQNYCLVMQTTIICRDFDRFARGDRQRPLPTCYME